MEPAADAMPPAGTAAMAAVAAIISAMVCAAVGNGLMFAYIPVRLGVGGFEPAWAGMILTGMSAGGIAGCFLTGRLAARLGHSLAFTAFAAMIVLSNMAIALEVRPPAWLAARAFYGFAIAGMFIVVQSWLNDIAANNVRGRVMAAFYVSYVVGLGIGSFLMGFLDLSGAQAPLLGMAFAALSVVPVTLTRLRPSLPPAVATVAFARAWAVSPVGVAGMLTVGGVSMMIAGFTPIHATASGYSQTEVATLLLAMPLGTLLLQLPFGWVSDRTDRRHVLMAASLLVAAAGIAAGVLDGSALFILIPVYMVWSGAAESIYSLSSAHANDRAGKEDLLALSSTMIFVWSVSGFIVPALVTGVTVIWGTQAFMAAATIIAAAYCAFVGWRIIAEPAVPAEEAAAFAPITAHGPPPAAGGQDPADETDASRLQ